MAITSYDLAAYEKKNAKKHEVKSPYLTNDRVQLLSRVTEKKNMHKKTLDYVSSFPLAVNVYKANSGDVSASRKPKKKNKKSVLTLTNERTPGSQKCTVSDINDSEYFSTTESSKSRVKKRTAVKNVRKARTKNKDYEFKDNRYCSQLNINVNNGAADVLGDYKRITSNVPQQNRKCNQIETKENRYGVAPHDVWGMLRNMNRFQFVNSPPMSEESEVILKKKKTKTAKKKFDDTTTSVIETTEFAYISSSYSVGESSHTLSESTSIDRVTVINKRDEFSKICKAFEQRFLKPNLQENSVIKSNLKRKSIVQKKKKGTIEALDNDDIKELEESTSQQCNDFCSSTEKKDNQVQTIENKSEANNTCSLDCVNIDSEHGNDKNENQAKTSDQVPINSRIPQLKGIFRKGIHDNASTVTFKNNDLEKKSCIITGMPGTMPKFAKNDLKKKIAALRFPVIILGKEQIRAPLLTDKNTFDHFAGMDKHIWPFMMGWYDVRPVGKEQSIVNHNQRPSRWNRHIDNKASLIKPDRRLRKNNELNMKDNFQIQKPIQTVGQIDKIKDKSPIKKPVQTEDRIERNKADLKRFIPIARPAPIVETQQPKKQRPMTHIKDKMLNLFQKLDKHLDYHDDKISPRYKIQPSNYTPVHREPAITTEKKVNVATVKPKTPVNADTPKDKIFNSSGFGYPWAKAKLASDFIENVIKKLKNGAYYNHDKPLNNVADTSPPPPPPPAIPVVPAIPAIPAKHTPQQERCIRDLSPKVTITKKSQDTPKKIPGFDCALPVFEIKTLNKNQISVKHRMSNVTMQFDVSVLVQARQIFMAPKTPISLIPLNEIGGQTKTFKCDTKIINAMLPAELCSILPKMLKQFNLAVSHITKPSVNFPRPLEPPLTSIPELEQLTLTNVHNTVTVFDFMSPRVKQILTGVFPIVKEKMKAKLANPKIVYDYDCLMLEMLPKIFFNLTDVMDYKIIDLVPRYPSIPKKEINVSNEIKSILPPVAAKVKPNNSSALQLYSDIKRSIVSSFKIYGLATILDKLLKSQMLGTKVCKQNVNIMGIKYDGRLLDIQLKVFDNQGNSMGLSNLKIDTQVCNNEKADLIFHNDFNSNSIKFIESTRNCANTESYRSRSKTVRYIPKKHKRYHRLYRKCKSLKPVPVPETNTPINKIATLTDFLQIIGTKGTLSGIFDDYSERKILSSVKQMQSWVTEINTVQALLVLLLVNKKDTTNLVRFRSIILQGIAVNRITRASELDMEIEVIERENLNKMIPQHDGISSLPAPTENPNQLLEELYWIAKTTASDYQKPFDESSEKHLKMLLEKRKKLNPSYLRVMARYVGLGLLKTPTKK